MPCTHSSTIRAGQPWDKPGHDDWQRFWSKPDPEVAKNRLPTVVQPDVVGYWPGGGGSVRGIQEYLQRVLDFIDFVPDLSLRAAALLRDDREVRSPFESCRDGKGDGRLAQCTGGDVPRYF
jgi:hypothetical protein